MNLSRSVRALGATAAGGLLVLTAACGSGSGTTSDTKESTGAAASSSASTDAGSSDKAAALTKDDLFPSIIAAQKKAGSYTYTLEVAGGPQKLTGTGEADNSGATPAVSSTIDAGDIKIQSIVIDGIYYFKGGPYGTDKWLKIDPKNDKSGLGALVGQFGSSDPASNLQALQGTSTVTKVGEEDVDGTKTTHYKVAVDSAAFAKAAKLNAQIAALLPKEIDYELYVDGDDLVRKVVTALAIQGTTTTTTITFADYGKPVSIKAPADSDTTTQFTPGS